MALVHEETKHDDLPVELVVSEREPRECRDPWRFVHLDVDNLHTYTPKELRELGHWLVKQGKRLGREFKSNGAPKAAA